MNMKQALALALGTLAALVLVLMPRLHTSPQVVSYQTLSNGDIKTVEAARNSPWQPAGFALVVLVTGVAVYRLRDPI